MYNFDERRTTEELSKRSDSPGSYARSIPLYEAESRVHVDLQVPSWSPLSICFDWLQRRFTEVFHER